MTAKNEPAGSDPSMDDILASIRRILDEEEAKPSEPPPMSEPVPHGLQPEDVLELEASMMVPDPDEAAPGPVPGPPPVLLEPVAAAAPQPVSVPLPDPVPPPPPLMAAEPPAVASPLVAPEAAAAAAVSVGALMRTLAHGKSTATHRGGPTIEEMVREEMRPLLKEWLDTHLAPMVERLVRAEIERVVNRSA